VPSASGRVAVPRRRRASRWRCPRRSSAATPASGLRRPPAKLLGKGFSEVVYKDALSIEFELKKIPFEREKQFPVFYKNIPLNRKYNCDFVVYDKIILEAKAQSCLTEEDAGQVVNYLAVTKFKVGLLVNFGESSLKFRRVVL
jgi:GxxExxY protein